MKLLSVWWILVGCSAIISAWVDGPFRFILSGFAGGSCLAQGYLILIEKRLRLQS